MITILSIVVISGWILAHTAKERWDRFVSCTVIVEVAAWPLVTGSSRPTTAREISCPVAALVDKERATVTAEVKVIGGVGL